MSKSDEIAELKARIETLEKAAQPKPAFVPPPRVQFDPTAAMSMPPEAVREMTAACDDRLLAEIVGDHLGKPTSLPLVASESPKSGSGWTEPKPLGPQPHTALIDAIVERFEPLHPGRQK